MPQALASRRLATQRAHPAKGPKSAEPQSITVSSNLIPVAARRSARYRIFEKSRNGNESPSTQSPIVSTEISSGIRAADVVCQIELILEGIFDGIFNDATELSIPYHGRLSGRRRNRGDQQAFGQAAPTGIGPPSSVGHVRFPGRTGHEAKKFAALLCVLRLAHEALLSGKPVTKRNIFYQNPDLFESQRAVDGLVDDLANTLGVGRNALNIVATAKGLVTGPITLVFHNGFKVSCAGSCQGAILIPPIAAISHIDLSCVRWVLVIEKDATFHTLSASQYWLHSNAGPGVLVTGKGFPDLLTREFLHAISLQQPRLPILGLFDMDPDGISILRTYKYGSLSLSHEENSVVSRMKWIGLKSKDTIDLVPRLFSDQNFQSQGHQRESHDTASQEATGSRASDTSSSLNLRDRRTAVNMLSSLFSRGQLDEEEAEQVRELQRILILGIKTEIQAVDHLGDVASWLDERLCFEVTE